MHEERKKRRDNLIVSRLLKGELDVNDLRTSAAVHPVLQRVSLLKGELVHKGAGEKQLQQVDKLTRALRKRLHEIESR